jgi:RNA polymerase sigma factor (sigma-70 family)
MDPISNGQPGCHSGWFNTTHWTVIRNAKSDDTAQAQDALSRLCQTYWAPTRTYIARVERNPADAEDLTQEFFTRFLEKMLYRRADEQRGRFRTFLLTCIKHFLINERERACAKKRGGGIEILSLDEEAAESGEARLELPDERTAVHAYEESWALTLLAHLRSRLEAEYAKEGKAERFAFLEQFLPGTEPQMTYGQAAERLGVPEGTVKSDVHRLKRRYREVLREEIAQTVETEAEIDEELRHLVDVLSNNKR